MAPAETREKMIELRQVTLNYGGGDVVKGVDLEVYRGETKVVLGPSGVGKSTILKAILGLLKPAAGEVFVCGQEMGHLAERDLVRIRLRMAMVFQHGALFDSMTVAENVSYRLRELNLASPDRIEERVNEVLQFVDLKGVKRLNPAELSGGMKKRVAIARALASNPEIFLFDEPTVGLDPVNFFNIEQLILKLKQETTRTLVIVTHDVESAVLLADSIVMLHEGKFIFEGTPEELKNQKDKRIQAFLDPATAAP